MNCKNCGAPLVPGQIFCSSCDYDNSAYVANANKYLEVKNTVSIANDIEPTNIAAHESSYHTDDEFKEQPKSEKNNKNIIKIIAIILLLPTIVVIILGILMLFTQSSINGTLAKGRKQNFVSAYQAVRKNVKYKIASDEEVACRDYCNEKYDLDGVSLTVTEYDNYYKIEMEALSSGKYADITLSNSDCSDIEETACSGNVIVGRVSK